MGFEEMNDRLVYCNPYANPLGWTSHLWGDFTPNKYDSPIIKFYEDNKKRNANNDDLKKLFPMLYLTTKAGKEIGEKVAENPENVIKAATNPILYQAGKEVEKDPSKLLRAASGPIGSILCLVNDINSTNKKAPTVEKIPTNLTTEERKEYIQEHGGGVTFPEKKLITLPLKSAFGVLG